MANIVGADGSRSGWVGIAKDTETGAISWERYSDVRDLFFIRPAWNVVAIDVPIGLPDQGPRLRDIEARRMLGQGRGSSVFPAPIRDVLLATSYLEASAIRFAKEAKKMSVQSWGIVPKIRDVDTVLRERPELLSIVREVHPEVCFHFMSGNVALQKSKKHALGLQERLLLLTPFYGASIQQALADKRALRCSADDIIDAFAALWTAERVLNGTAITLPAIPSTDACGLPMQIVV